MTEFDALVGENVQRYRTAAGMSQTDLANAISQITGQVMAQQTILKIEKGTRPLKLAEAARIAEILGQPIESLTGTGIARVADLRQAQLEYDKAATALRGSALAYAEARRLWTAAQQRLREAAEPWLDQMSSTERFFMESKLSQTAQDVVGDADA